MSVIVANSAGYGVRGGLITVVGNVAGIAILLVIVGLGLAWIAQAVQQWFDWLRIAGAFYLAYLGFSRIRLRPGRARRRLGARSSASAQVASADHPTGELLRDGFIVAVANPEVILFLAAFLPPFVDPSRPAAPQLFALSSIFIIVCATIGVLLAILAGQARNFLSGDRLRWIDIASGSLLLVAGLWLGWPRG